MIVMLRFPTTLTSSTTIQGVVEEFCLWGLSEKWAVQMVWEARWLKIQGVGNVITCIEEKMQLV